MSDVLGDDGIYNLTSNWEIIYSKSNGIILAFQKFLNIFDLIIIVIYII